MDTTTPSTGSTDDGCSGERSPLWEVDLTPRHIGPFVLMSSYIEATADLMSRNLTLSALVDRLQRDNLALRLRLERMTQNDILGKKATARRSDPGDDTR